MQELQKALGQQLLKPADSNVATAGVGQIAFSRAAKICQIGQLITDGVRSAAGVDVARFGVQTFLLNSSRMHCLDPMLARPSGQWVWQTGESEHLQAELALR